MNILRGGGRKVDNVIKWPIEPPGIVSRGDARRRSISFPRNDNEESELGNWITI